MYNPPPESSMAKPYPCRHLQIKRIKGGTISAKKIESIKLSLRAKPIQPITAAAIE
jgi:hypothetical protein